MPGKRPSGRTAAGKGNGPGMGAGWGGPAKGARPQRAAFTPETSAAANAIRFTPENLENQALRRAATAKARNTWLDVMDDPEAPHAAKVVAAEKLDNRLNDKPGASVKIGGDGNEPIKIEDSRRPVTEFLARALAEINAAAKDEG